ncbi:MAG: MFS transporter [Haliscomenobacter sp.]|nr:MFS transporter [Haliscomenobacter sp.]
MQTPALRKDDPRTIRSWAMYDWANSSYSLVVSSAIFPAYYNEVTRVNGSGRMTFMGLEVENTGLYSVTLGLSFGVVALVSPLLSSMSDYGGNHKSYMKFFCYVGALACMSLFFFTGPNLALGLAALMLATIGYSGSIVFYNSFLPAIASEARQDQVSARGYAYGYIGASTLLLLNLAAILNQKALGVTDDTLLPRLSFFLTGLWWLGFAQIPFARLPRGLYIRKPEGHFLLHGYQELGKVWKRLREEPLLRTFLLSFFFYIMGVQTVMFMAASFGEKEVGLPVTSLIITVLCLEYVGIAGAFLFAALSKRMGNLPALILAVCVWIGICIGALQIKTHAHFFITAVFIGLVMGGIQSLSRSTYAKLIPKTENNAGYFGFFDVCEKVAMMFGLVMFGYLDNLTGSMRSSIFVLTIWFAIGLILLLRALALRRA